MDFRANDLNRFLSDIEEPRRLVPGPATTVLLDEWDQETSDRLHAVASSLGRATDLLLLGLVGLVLGRFGDTRSLRLAVTRSPTNDDGGTDSPGSKTRALRLNLPDGDLAALADACLEAWSDASRAPEVVAAADVSVRLDAAAPYDGAASERATRVGGPVLALDLRCEPGHPVALQWHYRPDEFDAVYLTALTRAVAQAARHAGLRPDLPAARLPLVDGAASTGLARLGRGAPEPISAGCCLARFPEVAARLPHATALRWEGGSLTYTALMDQVRALARQLHAAGLARDDVATLRIDKSHHLVIAMLAVAALGATYCLTPPELDAARLGHILSETRSRLLLTTSATAEAHPLATGDAVPAVCPMLFVDEPATGDAAAPLRFDPSTVYVLYTSGSTGTPKGVPISHAALAQYLGFAERNYFGGLDGAWLVTSPYFDISVPALWLPLLNGGCLDLLPPGEELPRLAGRLSQLGLRDRWLIRLTPTHLKEVLDTLAPEPLTGAVHTLVVGGERLPLDLAQRARRMLPGCTIFNHYGPTETTVGCAMFDLAGLADRHGAVPIGRPMDGVELQVLDEDGLPCPMGVVGQLFIGGPGVSSGYLGGIDANRAFARQEAGVFPCTRVYASGDLVRWNSDGSLHYVGRNDGQVKLRGYRVETGAIEQVLRSAPEVTDAAVLVVEERGTQTLVAVVRGASGVEAAPIVRWREHCERHLPGYMRPSRFVAVDRLPVLRNGKLDRGALILSASEGGTAARPAPPPLELEVHAELEQRLASVWKEVLGLNEVRREDNFFDLGGHSLLAMRLIRLVQKAIGVKLVFRNIFQHQTLGAMTDAVRALQTASADGPAGASAPAALSATLSLNQRRLLFIDEVNGPSATYSLPSEHDIVGALDVELLRNCLQATVRRHEVLRTLFRRGGNGDIDAFVDTSRALEVPLFDATDEVRHDEIRARITGTAFDLTLELPIRAAIVRRGPERHTLLLNFHHIAVDGRSMSLFFSEIGRRYAGSQAGQTLPLPDPVSTYRQFASIEAAQGGQPAFADGVRFWRDALRGAPEQHGLPLDKPRPARPSLRGAEVVSTLPRTVLEGFRAICTRAGATLFMGMHAALATLVHAFSAQNDLVIGTAVANRDQEEFDEVIGFFSNTVALRTQITSEHTFAQVLAVSKDCCSQAFSHQSVPFDRVVDAVCPARTMAYSPVFQIALGLQEKPESPLELGDLAVTSRRLPTGQTKFDLTLNVEVRDSGAVLTLSYSEDVFRAESATRMARAFERLLHAVTASDEVAVGALDLLDDAGRARLVDQLGSSPRRAAQTQGLVERFLGWVRARPTAIAVRHGTEEVGYLALERRSRAVVTQLERAGAQPGDRIGVRLRRSIDLIVAVLAVRRLGAVCVPLDVEYPQERIRTMADIAGLRLTLTSRELVPQMAGLTGKALIVDTSFAGAEQDGPGRDFGMDAPAYILFTSGSTGTPKGAVLTEGAVVNRVAEAAYIDFHADDRVAQMSNSSFDPFPWEVWGALCAGASLHIVDKEQILDPRAFAGWVRAQRISKMIFTVAVLNNLVSEEPGALREVDTVVFGSDRIDVGQIRRLMEAGKPRRLVHAYGPTECLTLATTYDIRSMEAPIHPIGRPVDGTSCYVVTPQLALAPAGAIGEIVIGGESVATGYLDDEPLTRTRFVEVVLGGSRRERVYRTGDLGRWSADDQLEFIGRIDAQVKFRGFRIEPGEISAALLRLTDVQNAAVVCRPAESGERLVAYVVLAPGHGGADSLRAHLQSTLPAHMVPTDIVELAELPFTANGKLDYRALPAPSEGAPLQPDFQAPAGPTAEVLASLWGQRLGHARIGAHDNFFKLGGYSLLVPRILSDIRARFGVAMPVGEFFASPTVQGLAAAVERAMAAGPLATVKTSRPPEGGDRSIEYI